MKYSIKLIDNFNMLKDLNGIRTRIANEFEPTQELDTEFSIINSIDERNVESLFSFLEAKMTDDFARNERYSEMQLRLETL